MHKLEALLDLVFGSRTLAFSILHLCDMDKVEARDGSHASLGSDVGSIVTEGIQNASNISQ